MLTILYLAFIIAADVAIAGAMALCFTAFGILSARQFYR